MIDPAALDRHITGNHGADYDSRHVSEDVTEAYLADQDSPENRKLLAREMADAAADATNLPEAHKDRLVGAMLTFLLDGLPTSLTARERVAMMVETQSADAEHGLYWHCIALPLDSWEEMQREDPR